MGDFLKFIGCMGLLIICEVRAMDYPEYWKNVFDKTKANTLFYESADGYSEDAENALGGAETKINWDNVKTAAEKGNSLAQYVYSKHLLVLSRPLFNGKRRNMRFEAYMYLLISAVKGDFAQAIEDFKYAVDFMCKIPDFEKDGQSNGTALKWILSKASELSRE